MAVPGRHKRIERPELGDVGSGATALLLVENDLPIPITLFVSTSRDQMGREVAVLTPNWLIGIPVATDEVLNLISTLSGAFVCQFADFQPGTEWKEHHVRAADLTQAGAIGEPPFPDAIGPVATPNVPGQPLTDRSVVVPENSSPVLVGVGVDGQGQVLTREQYWALTNDSYALAPRERVEQSYLTTTGMAQTSSSFETVQATASTSASAGWGPISASVSASMSASMGRQQQVTFNTQTTTSVLQLLDNSDQESGLVVYRWQLVERITWWRAGSMSAGLDPDDMQIRPADMLATITSGRQPIIPIGLRVDGDVVNLATGRILRRAARA